MSGPKLVGGKRGSRKPESTFYSSPGRGKNSIVDMVRAAMRDYGIVRQTALPARNGSGRREGGIELPTAAGVASIGITESTQTPAAGEIEIAASGPGSINRLDGDDATTFTWENKSILTVESLPATGDPEIIYLQESDNKLYRDTDGQGTWEELTGVTDYADLTGRPFTLDASAIKFASASYHLELIRASGNVLIATRTGETNGRFALSTDGALAWGPGSAGPDIGLSRIRADMLGLSTDDGFRAERLLELKQNPINTPASVPSGYTSVQADGEGRICAIDDADNVHDLSVASTDRWHLAEGKNGATDELNCAYATDPGISMGDGFQNWTTQFTAVGGFSPNISSHFARLSVAVNVINDVEVLYSKGSVVIFGSAFDRAGDTALFRIRARLGSALVNSAALNDVIFFVCEEGSSTNQTQVDLTTTPGSGSAYLSTTWQYWELSVDMSGWTAMHTTKSSRWGVQVRCGQAAPGAGEIIDETVNVDFELVSGRQWVY